MRGGGGLLCSTWGRLVLIIRRGSISGTFFSFFFTTRLVVVSYFYSSALSAKHRSKHSTEHNSGGDRKGPTGFRRRQRQRPQPRHGAPALLPVVAAVFFVAIFSVLCLFLMLRNTRGTHHTLQHLYTPVFLPSTFGPDYYVPTFSTCARFEGESPAALPPTPHNTSSPSPHSLPWPRETPPLFFFSAHFRATV